MRLDELRRLRDLLAKGGGPEAIFMSLRDRSLQGPALQQALAGELRRWLTITSIERYGGNPGAQDLARQLQRELHALHAEALARVQAAEPAPDPAVPTDPVAPPELAATTVPPELTAATIVPTEPATTAVAPEFATATVAPTELTAATIPVDPVAAPAPAADAPEPRASLRVEVDRVVRDFFEHLGDGDLCEIWRAPGGDGDPCVAKVALAAADNDLVCNEAEVLQRLHAGDAPQRALLPRLGGRFFTSDGRAGNLLGFVEGLSGLQLRARLPGGVPPEHIVWIARRLLSVIGHAHHLGILHGNIEPAHIIVRPRDHRVVLIDWCYAVVEPARTGQTFKAIHDEYSAPEVAQRGPATPAADLFSLGRTLAYLLGADSIALDLPDHVPDRIARFVRYLARPSRLQRAQDAWEMYHEMARIREVVYGPPVSREFVV